MVCFVGEVDAPKEHISPLSLLKLFLTICPKQKIDQLKIVLKDLQNLAAIKVLSKHAQKIVKIQMQLQLCFIVIRIKKRRNYLVFDGSQTPLSQKKICWNLIILENGKVIKRKFCLDKFFGLKIVYPSYWTEQTIIELLANFCNQSNLKNNLLESIEEEKKLAPHNFKTTKNMLIRLNLWGKITIFFCTSFLPYFFPPLSTLLFTLAFYPYFLQAVPGNTRIV